MTCLVGGIRDGRKLHEEKQGNEETNHLFGVEDCQRGETRMEVCNLLFGRKGKDSYHHVQYLQFYSLFCLVLSFSVF